MAFEGGCACKNVRYTVSAEPVATMNCHCRACQYASGGAYTTAVVVPRGSLTIAKGTPKGYASKGDSGAMVTRYFCPDCGSPIYSDPAGAPFEVLKAASLDDPSTLVVGGALYVSEAQPWAQIDPAKPQFPKMPPRAG
ncbi:MAG: GFA family protein [Alphaproteobacteria bacterium]|nr:GFA family protein [Alphaproteobacteria bacterium]MBV9693034.1 GFA family protein [Alphaproteobacteria bacterium]